MLKKCFLISALGVFLVLPTLPAKTAPTNPSDSATLANVEGVLSFCSKVDSQSTIAITYKQVDQLITNNIGAPTIAQLRNSDAYESAYQQVTKTLKALPAKQALAACNGQ